MEAPTLPAWALATIDELHKQIDRLRSGQACRACRGAGAEVRTGSAGEYERACGACDGTGLKHGAS
jgi:DnaJ-class molecular chaperone